MICQGVNRYKYDADGAKHVTADLLASTTPATMPTTGEDIEGLDATDVLEAGSTLYIVNSGTLYMMNEEHEFKEQ
jgi:hypothetical protein